MKFILKRILISVITLFLVSALTFAAFNIIPGDPVRLMLGIDAPDEQVESLRIQLGLDRPLSEQYINWLVGFITGNSGMSIKYQMPLSELIADRLPVTFCLASLSLLFVIVISIPIAFLSARKQGSIIDRCINALTTISISIPQFFLGILLIWVFGLILKLFNPGGYVAYQDDAIGFIRYMIYPSIAVAIPNCAIVIMFLRTSIFQQLSADYVRTAYSKGNILRRVLFSHVFKNAVIPALTLLGMIIGDIFSGSIVIEQVFTIPGLGRLLITSITSRDFPLVQTIVVYIAFIVVFANTLVDITMQIIDPRIRVK